MKKLLSKDRKNPLEIITKFLDFLIVEDLSMLHLEISSMIQNYPDIKQEHIVAIISLREETKDAKGKVKESWPETIVDPNNNNNFKTIFSDIEI